MVQTCSTMACFFWIFKTVGDLMFVLKNLLHHFWLNASLFGGRDDPQKVKSYMNLPWACFILGYELRAPCNASKSRSLLLSSCSVKSSAALVLDNVNGKWLWHWFCWFIILFWAFQLSFCSMLECPHAHNVPF